MGTFTGLLFLLGALRGEIRGTPAPQSPRGRQGEGAIPWHCWMGEKSSLELPGQEAEKG